MDSMSSCGERRGVVVDDCRGATIGRDVRMGPDVVADWRWATTGRDERMGWRCRCSLVPGDHRAS